MGYTHYWSHDYIDHDSWIRLIDDARRIINAIEVPVGNGLGEGEPVLTEDEIRLNGKNGNDYETFLLTPDPTGFDFCKTGLRPYDVVVTTVLLRATLTIPGFNIRSDGDWSDWRNAQEAYEYIFQEPAPEADPFRRS